MLGQFENQVLVAAFGDRQFGDQDRTGAVDAGERAGRRTTGEPPTQRPAASGPHPVVAAEVAAGVVPEPGAGFQHDGDLGGAPHGDDAAQHHDPAGVGRKRQGFPAFDLAVVGDPVTVPDQAARLVVAAPHVPPLFGGDGVAAPAADQRGEHRVGIPARRAQPRHFPVRTDQRAAFTVGQQRVLAQHLRRECRKKVDARSVRHSEPLPRPPFPPGSAPSNVVGGAR
ncbi:hypothetical protein C1Y40_00315 [Mycobacterium talmoniae]|uniref:Uncharacterized protein n=1 Tax=Mycobacterium talmoniae TaxID=1858794 RepID=A0A2S8BS13_9MYCO|nr:hypothetical protein C1Y40_00315 [Mycobacterium talmoniae]